MLDYDGERVTFDVEGDTAWGAPGILLDQDDNLVASRPWADAGFSVEPFLSPPDYEPLVAGVQALLERRIAAAGLTVPSGFSMERYHEPVTTDAAHATVADQGPWCWGFTDLPVPVEAISRRISEILGLRVSTAPPHAEFPEHFCFRVVRPRSRDNNPPHRDVWLDRLRHAVNIYVPLAGSSAQSSPSGVGATHPIALERPDPGPNEVLVFWPCLIHGGAYNQQPDRTRVSLEMRFWRVA